MKIFVRLCKLVGSQCPSKAVCHCSKACETTAVKSAMANNGKIALEMLSHLENQIDKSGYKLRSREFCTE